MKSVQKIMTAEMLLKIDPQTDFASFQDSLPPLLRQQVNLFGEHMPNETDELMAIEQFHHMFAAAKNGFDRRKTDRRDQTPASPANRRSSDMADQQLGRIDTKSRETVQHNYNRRKTDNLGTCNTSIAN